MPRTAPEPAAPTEPSGPAVDRADWQQRVVGRSLRAGPDRSVDRAMALVSAAAAVLERADGGDITVQEVADQAGQSLRTLYQYFERKDDLLLAVFEEAMRAYARLVRDAIAHLDDPLERLAGAMLAAVTMPSISDSGFDRGLARLRLRLADTQPDLVGGAQRDLEALVRELVVAAAEAGRLDVGDTDSAAFVLVALNASYITTERLGNDVGPGRPDVHGMVTFCLRGLGATVDEGFLDAVGSRVRLPSRRPPLVAR